MTLAPGCVIVPAIATGKGQTAMARARYTLPPVIEYPEQYARATEEAIKANARKGRGRRWLAADPTRAQLIDAIRARADKAPGFFRNMADAIDEWGSLTDGQEAACRRILAADAAKVAEFKARDAASVHLGAIGERMTVTARVSFRTTFEGTFGAVTVTGLRDAAGNVLIVKGVPLRCKATGARADKGDTVTFVGTVKAHNVREGVRQTQLARPTVKSLEQAPPKESPAD